MILGRVVGEAWAARRHPGLSGRKLLIIRPHQWYDPPFEVAHLVAVDPVGAGVGEDVLVCMGDPGRRHLAEAAQAGGPSPLLPIDATVMAIVDSVELDEAAAFPAPGGRGVSAIAEAERQRPLGFVGPRPAWAGPR